MSCSTRTTPISDKTDAYPIALDFEGEGGNRAAGKSQSQINCRWKALALPPQPELSPGAFVPLKPKNGRREYGAVLPRFGGGYVALLFWPTVLHATLVHRIDRYSRHN